MSLKNLIPTGKRALATAVLLTTVAVGTHAGASERVRWQVPLPVPSQLVGLGTPIQHWIGALKTGTGDRIQLRYYEPGALVPPFEIMSAVSSGRFPAGITWIGYDQGTMPATTLFAGAPFGMEPTAYIAWHYHGGGRELLEELYQPRNIKPLLCGLVGPESAGWFNKPIDELEDLKGMRIRYAGVGGQVLAELGASVTMIPAGELYQAMERGTIDGLEFSQPAVDEALGLHQVASHLLMPGWHQSLTATHMLVNKRAWNSLDEASQVLIELACEAGVTRGLAESEHAQSAAIARYRERGIEPQMLPDEVLEELQRVSNAVMDRVAERDEMFARVLSSQRQFMDDHQIWLDMGYVPRRFHSKQQD